MKSKAQWKIQSLTALYPAMPGHAMTCYAGLNTGFKWQNASLHLTLQKNEIMMPVDLARALESIYRK